MHIAFRSSIRSKVLGNFLLIILTILTFAIFLIVSLNIIKNSGKTLNNKQQELNNFFEIELIQSDLNIAVKSYIITQDPKWEQVYDQNSEAFSNALNHAIALEAKESDTLKIKELMSVNDSIKGTELLILADVREGNIEKARNLFDATYDNEQSKIAQALNELIKEETQANTDLIVQNNHAVDTLTVILFIFLSLIGIIFFVSYNLIFRFVVKPVKELTLITHKIVEGNFNIRAPIKSKDEIGELASSFNSMVDKLNASYDEELQKEGARLRASIDNAPVGFLLLDNKVKILVVNQRVSEILNIEKDFFSFRDIQEILKDVFDIYSYCQDILLNKKSSNTADVSFHNKFLKFFFNPIISPQDHQEIIGVVILIEDITEAKLLEQSKTSFIAITTHELRTPLTIIRGNAELLLQRSLDEPMRKMADAIQRSTVRLLGIVNDFLDLTVLEEHRMQFRKDSFDIMVLVEEVAAEFKERIAKKNLFLNVVKPKSVLPYVIADSERTKEVVVNLLSNALQYTERGGITLEFLERGGFIKLLVIDTGIGIKPEVQSLLFQKFQTVGDRFIHSKEYGSGMGLYISKLLISSMGGGLRLEKSVVGEGSTFSVLLPAASAGRAVA